MTLRTTVVDYVAQNRADWHDVILSTYVLAQKDRIGHFGIEARQGLPALWGHSYVRTYYAWAGTPPPSRDFMEGGIATTYYVVKALSQFHKKSDSAWEEAILKDIAKFFKCRIRPDGVGVLGMDAHGFPKIVTHLRHTCYGYLILADLLEVCGDGSEELRMLANKSADLLIDAFTADELLQEWIPESWPIGGIASYIAAREHLYNSKIGNKWPPHEKRCWPDVREAMLDALAELSSTHLSLLGAIREPGKRALSEHLPYWHPIKDAPILRLHSTLGCLSLVGKDIAKREFGQSRIREIVKDLRQQVLMDPQHAPRFCHDSSPSFAAACAMLKLVLGPWYEPTNEDREFVLYLLDFLRLRWKDPEVYTDYWTEFTAPILQIDELLSGLDTRALVRESEFFIEDAEPLELGSYGEPAGAREREFLSFLDRITPVALGLESKSAD